MTTQQDKIANPELVVEILEAARQDIGAAQAIVENALRNPIPIRVGLNTECKVRLDIHLVGRWFVLFGYDFSQPEMEQEWRDAPEKYLARQREDENAPKFFAGGRSETVGWYMVDYGEGDMLAQELGVSGPEFANHVELVQRCAESHIQQARPVDQEHWGAKDWLNLRHFGSPVVLVVETEQERLQMSFMQWLGGLYVLEQNLHTGVVRTYTVSIFEQITVGQPLILTPLTVTPQGEFVRGTSWQTALVVAIKRSHDEFMVMANIPAEPGVAYTVFDTKTWRAAATARSYSRAELLRACRITLQLAASREDAVAVILVNRDLLDKTESLMERFFEGEAIEAPEVENLIATLKNPSPFMAPELVGRFPKPFWYVVRFLGLLQEELQTRAVTQEDK